MLTSTFMEKKSKNSQAYILYSLAEKKRPRFPRTALSRGEKLFK